MFRFLFMIKAKWYNISVFSLYDDIQNKHSSSEILEHVDQIFAPIWKQKNLRNDIKNAHSFQVMTKTDLYRTHEDRQCTTTLKWKAMKFFLKNVKWGRLLEIGTFYVVFSATGAAKLLEPQSEILVSARGKSDARRNSFHDQRCFNHCLSTNTILHSHYWF